MHELDRNGEHGLDERDARPRDGPPSPPDAGDLGVDVFDDEPPGATLGSLRAPRGWLVWSIVQFGLVVGLSAPGAFLRGAGGESLPLTVVWNLLLVASICQLLAILFVGLNQTQADRAEKRRCAWIAAMQLACLGVWLFARFGIGLAISGAGAN